MTQSSDHPIAIAVLPFENLSQDKELQLFCDGFTDDLVTALSHFRQFQIICLQTTGQTVDLRNRANFPYQSDYFIRGSFRSFGDQVRINAQLIEAKNSRLIWADRFQNSLESLSSLQEEIHLKLVASLQQQLEIDLLTQVRKRHTTNIKAYEYWLYGLNELKKGSLESDETAREYFQKAIEVDPNYSLAYSGMSLSYFNEWSCQLWDIWDISQKGAKEWAEKALQLDPHNYIANLVAGKIYLFERDFDKASVFLEKALKLNPNDPFSLIHIASGFVFLGYLEEAQTLYRRALEINPVGEDYYHPVGALIAFEMGEFQECLDIGSKYAAVAWLDYPAIISAANFFLGNVEESLKLWKMYENLFRIKIVKDEIVDSGEALRWLIDLNPYRYESRFKEFWAYIGKLDPYSLSTKPGFGKFGNSYPNKFVKEGDIWTISFEGDTIQSTGSKGFQDIARLLSQPYESIHCAELHSVTVMDNPVETVDEKALRTYRKKLMDLQREIQIAEENNQLAELEVLRQEHDQFLHYLSSSISIDGRARKIQGTDKARSAVTQRIRSAIRKIEKVHSKLGSHLSTSIKTGFFCTYSPPAETNWEL